MRIVFESFWAGNRQPDLATLISFGKIVNYCKYPSQHKETNQKNLFYKSTNLCSPGFLRCVQPVLVSRKDPDSRRNTILEIERRAKSGGRWPQVSASTILV